MQKCKKWESEGGGTVLFSCCSTRPLSLRIPAAANLDWWLRSMPTTSSFPLSPAFVTFRRQKWPQRRITRGEIADWSFPHPGLAEQKSKKRFVYSNGMHFCDSPGSRNDGRDVFFHSSFSERETLFLQPPPAISHFFRGLNAPWKCSLYLFWETAVSWARKRWVPGP